MNAIDSRATRRSVVVLGGNAFASAGRPLTMEGQLQFAHEAIEFLLPVLRDGSELLISHGNGPQVGQILTRVEAALGRAYAIPLEVCVAESEGELGYVLMQAIDNVLGQNDLSRPTVAILSEVIVAADDPAFSNPTKPIGTFYDAGQARELKRHGFAVRGDAGRGYRRVVASPRPREVVELEVIRNLVEKGVIVIAAGGGGIPVVREGKRLAGIEAVVDKDSTAALLADRLEAEQLVILTDVPCAYLHFRTPRQSAIGHLTCSEARALIGEGHFAAGSMLPKMEAVADFTCKPGRSALICNPRSLERALCGQSGTMVVSES